MGLFGVCAQESGGLLTNREAAGVAACMPRRRINLSARLNLPYSVAGYEISNGAREIADDACGESGRQTKTSADEPASKLCCGAIAECRRDESLIAAPPRASVRLTGREDNARGNKFCLPHGSERAAIQEEARAGHTWLQAVMEVQEAAKPAGGSLTASGTVQQADALLSQKASTPSLQPAQALCVCWYPRQAMITLMG